MLQPEGIDLVDTLALQPLRHLKALQLEDRTWEGDTGIKWPMHWSTLTSVTALICSVPSKLPKLVGMMTNIRSLEIEYFRKQNRSQQDRLQIQSLTRLTSLKIVEGNRW